MCQSDSILVAQDLVSGDTQIQPFLKEYLLIQMNLTLRRLRKQGNLIKARYYNDPSLSVRRLSLTQFLSDHMHSLISLQTIPWCLTKNVGQKKRSGRNGEILRGEQRHSTSGRYSISTSINVYSIVNVSILVIHSKLTLTYCMTTQNAICFFCYQWPDFFLTNSLHYRYENEVRSRTLFKFF